MSRLGSLLKPSHSTAATVTLRFMSTTTCTTTRCQHGRRCQSHTPICHDNPGGRAASPRKLWERSLEQLFIHSLLAASSCRKHREKRPFISHQAHQVHQQTRSISSHTRRQQNASAKASPEPDISREEYEELVNTYPSFLRGSTPPRKKLAKQRAAANTSKPPHFPLAPRLVLTPEQEQEQGQGKGQRQEQELSSRWKVEHEPEDKEHAHRIWLLRDLLERDPGRVSQKALWQAWEQLPHPRVPYLPNATVHRLFTHLSWVEYKTEEGMQRYFALLNECVGGGVPISPHIWNTAIMFSGRWIKRSTSTEVKAAVETWMRMEQSGRGADHVTFNVLFHVAVRAGRFALADTIFNELMERNMPLDRYFRSSVIFAAGMRRDGDGVRQAFRDLVNAGEIVDTIVMNTVIVSLLRSGEAPAAENVFLRMKALHEQKFGTAGPRDWVAEKQLGVLLNQTGKRLREERKQHEKSFFGARFSTDEKREAIQKASPIAPNAGTYKMFIQYHTHTSGNLDKIREYLTEMKTLDFHIHGSIYLHMLRGFDTHGGYAFSPWNRLALEDLWDEILASSARSMPSQNSPPENSNPETNPSNVTESYDLLGAMLSERCTSESDPGEDDTQNALHSQPIDSGFFQEIAERDRPVYFTYGMATAAVRAFHKCTGRRRMLEVWEEIQVRWRDASDDDRQRVQETVDQLVREDSVYIV